MSASRIPDSSHNSGATTHLLPLLWLFLFALAIRWIYALCIYAAMGDGGLVVADGNGYMSDARHMVELLRSGTLRGGCAATPCLFRSTASSVSSFPACAGLPPMAEAAAEVPDMHTGLIMSSGIY